MSSVNSPREAPALTLLAPIAMAALGAGRMLMEAGASASSIEEIVTTVARGLGAERVELRIGYASLAVTLGLGNVGITRMLKVGPLGVNQQLDQNLWHLAARVSRQELTIEQTSTALARLMRETPSHPLWLRALSVGLACAAFGRLLGADWAGSGSVFVAAAAGQYIRGKLLHRKVNAFLCTALVSFLSSILGGLLGAWAGTTSLMTAVVASVLLLVPGVPAVNAQNDILDGRPTLGSARAVTVIMTLVFMAAGLWISRTLLIWWRLA
jgi:uncharacterized membrane protein YjjP (DUF1212 family)